MSATPTQRYTSTMDPQVEERIDTQLRTLARGVQEALGKRLVALLLVGSYGRGEGATGRVGEHAGPSNDYDLIAVVQGRAHALRSNIEEISHHWSARLGVEVTIWPTGARELAALPPTLFWLDVALGGMRVLAGDEALADAEGPLGRLRPRDVPLDEAGRLLANRAVGLALTALGGSWAEPGIKARHAHKAVLASGDALLLAADRYAGRLIERAAELRRLAAAPAVGAALCDAYEEALRYRARTDAWIPPGGASLDAWYARTVAMVAAQHLSFEAWRVGAPTEPLAFARWSGRLYLRFADVRPGGALAASLRTSWKRLTSLRTVGRHPRETLARVAAALAYAAGDEHARAHAFALMALPPGASPTSAQERLVALSSWGG